MNPKLSLAAVLVLSAASAAQAQTFGRLSGRVTDADNNGKPVIGATIRIDGTGLGGISKAPDGSFLIAGIRPGEYDVSISFIGYSTVRRKVTISIDQTTVIDVEMSTRAVEHIEIPVYGSPSQGNPHEKFGGGTILPSTDLEVSPYGTSIIGAVSQQAGITPVGGSGFSMRGARPTETALMVDGLSIGDPFTGAFGNTSASLFPTVTTLALQEVQATLSGIGAEYANTLSGQVNSVTRAGRRDRYEGAFRLRTDVGALYGSSGPITVRKAGTDRDTTLPAVKAESAGSTIYEFAFGGPVPGLDRLTFFIAGKYNPIDYTGASYRVYDVSPEYTRQRASIAESIGQPQLTPTNLGQLPNSSAMVRDLSAKLKLVANDAVQIELSGESGLTRREIGSWENLYMLDHPTFRDPAPGLTRVNDTTYVNQSYLERDAQTLNQNTIINRGTLRYFQTLDAASYFEAIAGYVLYREELGRRDVSKSYGPFAAYDIYAPVDADNDVIIDRYASPSFGERNSLTGLHEGAKNAGASYNPYGLNDLRFPAHGSDGVLESRESQTLTLKGAYETNFNLGGIQSRIKAGFEVASYTLRRQRNTLPWDSKPFFDVYGYESNYFHDDTTGTLESFFSKPYHPLTGSLYASTSFNYKDVVIQPGVRFDFLNPNTPAAPVRRTSIRQIVGDLDSLGNAKVKFQVSPRLGVNYPVTDNSQLRVNFAAVYKMPEFNLLYDNAYGDAQRTGQIFGNPDIDPQKVLSYELGYAMQLGAGSYLDVSAYYRDIYNQSGVSYVPVLPTPYTIYSVQEYGNVRGLQLTARHQFTDNIRGELNYTLQQARGTASAPTSNYALITASADPFTGGQQSFPLAEFPLSYDQTHTLNGTLTMIWGDGQGPALGGIRPLENVGITLTGNFATGTPYTLEDSRGMQVGQYNSHRLPSTFETEAHIEKGFKLRDLLGDGVGNLRISFFADIFNLLNSTGPLNVRASRNSGGSIFAISENPDNDGTTMSRGLGEFTATPYYRDIQSNRPETMDARQYDSYGTRLYNVYADANLDGVVTQQEKFDGYQRYVMTKQSLRETYQFPRRVYMGFRISF